MGEIQNYLHPITIEAKLFSDSLNANIAENQENPMDANMIEALENVVSTIDKFIKSRNTEIVESSNTKLLKCNNLEHIKRIYHCIRCKMDLGKNSNRVALHLTNECNSQWRKTRDAVPNQTAATQNGAVKKISKEERKEKRSQRNEKRFAEAVKLRKKAIQFLSLDQRNLYNFLSDSVQLGDKLKFIPDYDVIENDLLELMKPLFRNDTIKVYKFGSRVSGMGTRESDLDLFIDIGDTFKNYQNRASQATIKRMYKVRDALKNQSRSWKGLVVIDKARVPILKIIHAKSSIECDINFSNSLGYINTELMEYIFSLQPIARLLCMYMKKWLIRTNLKTEFSTYSINLMVIFYLQQLQHLPAMSKLFLNVDLETALVVGPWLGTYLPLTLTDLNLQQVDTTDLIKFIEGFFKFYLDFDFGLHVICPYTGKAIKRDELSMVMPSRYTTYVAKDKDLEIELRRPMAVQDPIQLNHNVMKGINDFNFQVFREHMNKSHEIILKSNSAYFQAAKNNVAP